MVFSKMRLQGVQTLLVLIDCDMITPSVFSFDTPVGKITIYDVINGNVEYLEALLDLYKELFPQYVSALPQIRERAFLPVDVDPRFIRHQWVVVWNECPIGMVSFRYVVQQGVGLCLSIAIRPDYRSLAWDNYRRLSAFLIRQMVKQLEVDAAANGSSALRGLVLEIEMAMSKKPYLHLLARYEEYGFLPLPIVYYEPSFVRGNVDDDLLPATFENAQPMKLYMLPICAHGQVYLLNKKLLNDVIDALLLNHYGLPENHWIVKKARKSIENLGETDERRN